MGLKDIARYGIIAGLVGLGVFGCDSCISNVQARNEIRKKQKENNIQKQKKK